MRDRSPIKELDRAQVVMLGLVRLLEPYLEPEASCGGTTCKPIRFPGFRAGVINSRIASKTARNCPSLRGRMSSESPEPILWLLQESLGIGLQHAPQPDECPHDLHVDLSGARDRGTLDSMATPCSVNAMG